MSTTFVTFEWAEPEPEIVYQQIIETLVELEQMRVPMREAGVITAMDTAEHFASESDPSGVPWKEWSDSYAPWARAHGSGKILNLEGALESSITSPSSWLPTNEGLFLDTSRLPEYWAWNNFGAYDRSTKSLGTDVFGDIGGFANVLPMRPFVGLSPEAQAKCHLVFSAWFERVVSGQAGDVGVRHSLRGKGGRFVSTKEVLYP